MAAALVGRAIRARNTPEAAETFGHILNYAKAFPLREMGVMLVSDLLRAVGDDLFAIPEFARWAESIGDIMLYD
ncbi:MAG: hypothetical protein R3E95_10480 [Thiolinea sp.]